MAKTHALRDRERSRGSPIGRWAFAPGTSRAPAAAGKLLLLDTIGCGYAALDEKPRTR